MRLNADFSKRVVIDTRAMKWEDSPMAGVARRKLDRIGDEVARATSLVRYAPKSYFSAHSHGGGEEFLVLDGVFSDEHGDYPAGTYVRNPIGSSHTPHSEKGCIIFVKLHQFDAGDTRQFSVATRNTTFLPGGTPGLSVLPLHNYQRESCALKRLAADAEFSTPANAGGEELLVLEGAMTDGATSFETGNWVRSPDGVRTHYTATEDCLFWIKTGHLPSRRP